MFCEEIDDNNNLLHIFLTIEHGVGTQIFRNCGKWTEFTESWFLNENHFFEWKFCDRGKRAESMESML